MASGTSPVQPRRGGTAASHAVPCVFGAALHLILASRRRSSAGGDTHGGLAVPALDPCPPVDAAGALNAVALGLLVGAPTADEAVAPDLPVDAAAALDAVPLHPAVGTTPALRAAVPLPSMPAAAALPAVPPHLPVLASATLETPLLHEPVGAAAADTTAVLQP
eukprot:CAMPEP_0175728758 /NCGR_PEP_ID=MMETSP0097-20121207/49461_1 /TAXON_ID=311494 /ORGANISM="Alexandrium monilatum, Strain CCMP3105" /LENGTH=163 /DNA_ID=CAMNT_0017036615 /DNA_START=149 /DNA_END=638 /DNA_ORIENTATION=+